MYSSLFRTFLSAFFTCTVFSSLPQAQASEPGDSLSVTLEQTVQFSDLEGEDVLVSAGDYSVKIGEEQFTLIGNDSKTSTIEANIGSHSNDIPSPTLVYLSSDEEDIPNTHALVLFYPDGRTLQAVGSDPEVISRGTLEPTADDLAYIDPALVEFDQPVHFTDPNGNPVVVQPGTYTAEAADKSIRLLSGTDTSKIIVIEAQQGTNDTELEDFLALSFPGTTPKELDSHYVMLLLPTGQSLEATGSYSGIHTRNWLKKTFNRTKKSVSKGYRKVTTSPAFKKVSKGAQQVGKAAQQGTKAVGGGLKKGWDNRQWVAGQVGKGIVKGAKTTWEGTKWVGKQIGKGGLIAAKAVCKGSLWTANKLAKGYEFTIGRAKKELARLLKVDKTQKAMRKAIDRIKQRNGEAIRRTIDAALILSNPKNAKSAKDLIHPKKMCDRPKHTVQRSFQKMIGGPVRRALAVATTGKDTQVRSRGSFASASLALGGGGAKVGGGEGAVRFSFDFLNKPHWFIDVAGMVKTNIGGGGAFEIGIWPRKNPVDTGGWFLGAAVSFPCKVFYPKLSKEVGCNLDFFWDFPLRFEGSVFKPKWDLTSWGFFLDHFQGFAVGIGGGKNKLPADAAIKIGYGIRVSKK